jgi:hypothetical protein
LPNANEPPKVLKQGVDQGNPNYRPVIGFNHNRSQFASVGEAGHRVVNHYTSNQYHSSSNSGMFIVIKYFKTIQISFHYYCHLLPH